MGDFHLQELTNTAWAFARAGRSDVSLFAALATPAERHMGDFNSQGLANVAWAFATAGRNDASLFAAVAIATEQCMGSFNPADLLKFLRSYEWINGKDESLTRTITFQHECKYVFSNMFVWKSIPKLLKEARDMGPRVIEAVVLKLFCTF